METDEDKSDEEFLASLRPSNDEVIKSKLRYNGFARTMLWLIAKSEREDFIYSRELRKFLRTSMAYVNDVLSNFVDLNLLKKTREKQFVSYYFVKNDDKPIIQKYKELTKKQLGLDYK